MRVRLQGAHDLQLHARAVLLAGPAIPRSRTSPASSAVDANERHLFDHDLVPLGAASEEGRASGAAPKVPDLPVRPANGNDGVGGERRQRWRGGGGHWLVA